MTRTHNTLVLRERANTDESEQKLLISLIQSHLQMFKIYSEQESNDSIRQSTLMFIAFRKGARMLKIISVSRIGIKSIETHLSLEKSSLETK